MSRLANLIALSSLAVLLVSLSGAPTTALAADSHHVVRSIARGHGSIAKRKRANAGKKAKRCRVRPTPPGGDNTSPAPESPNVGAPVPSGDSPAPSGDAPTAGSPTPDNNYTPPADQPTPTPDTPTPTPDNSASASPSPTSGNNNGGGAAPPSNPGPAGFAKGGVAWPMGNNPGITRIKTDKMGWYYTWSPYCVDGADAVGFQCLRMLWGFKQEEEFNRLVPSNGDGKWLLFVNEPNQHDQSVMSPWDAAALWQRSFQWRKDQGYRLISAATTSAPDGIQWMRDFMSACGGCTVDAIAIHYYDISVDDFKNYVNKWREFGRPIFVTEYACQNFNGGPQCSNDQIYNFMGETMRWMDQQPDIYGYAYFGWMFDMYNVNPANRLLGDGDWPTDLGWFSIH